MTMPNAIIIPTIAAPDVPPLKAVVDESGAETTNDSTPVSLTGRLSDLVKRRRPYTRPDMGRGLPP